MFVGQQTSALLGQLEIKAPNGQDPIEEQKPDCIPRAKQDVSKQVNGVKTE